MALYHAVGAGWKDLKKTTGESFETERESLLEVGEKSIFIL